jgi:hypothetical protein
MTARTLFGLWPLPLVKAVRRWLIRRQLAQIKYDLAHIKLEREIGFHVERMRHSRQAVLTSDLHNL